MNNNEKYTVSEVKRQLLDGVIFKNPALIQLLGMCPALAVTTSVSNAIGMGLAVTAVLMLSNLMISLFSRFIPAQVRIASYIVIISGFVTAIELLIRAFLPELDKSLGVFIPLIVVNCVILARAEAYASRHKPLPSLVDGLANGLGFTLSLTLMGTVREILGSGSFFGIQLFGESYRPVLLFIMPAGAFITLGFLVAGAQKLSHILGRRIKAESEHKVEAKKERLEAMFKEYEPDVTKAKEDDR
nr:electron transport complex subunit E [Clostridia bacterium]